ncbi:zinc finger BED domain-containing protein DAYSLEEPER-like [Eutrema salsugineum]|uniref:zinc finger BED domain-containing protein DAYSLEEPER-like n=1 Tax=Eutrema salsugineum TaxID=72664 RepID=UPI000CED041F|nr:zinc finger BED domain-containing protein DAYSLEEPER-like [Eutrema salsugineum]
MVIPMKEKFDKYWEELSDILAIAAVLDPKLKFAFLEYCYNTLDPATTQLKLAHVRRKMVKLFGAYKRNTSSITTTTSHTSRDIPSGYDGFYSYFSQKTGGSGKSPLDTYLDELVLDLVSFRSMNVLDYWKDNASRFIELSSMTCDVLSIPITTMASESTCSIGSCLLPRNVQVLICARNWFRGFEKIGDEIEFVDEEEEEA